MKVDTRKLIKRLCKFYGVSEKYYYSKKETQAKRMLIYIMHIKLEMSPEEIVDYTGNHPNVVKTIIKHVSKGLTTKQEKAVYFALNDNPFEDALVDSKRYLNTFSFMTKKEIDGYCEFIAECMLFPLKVSRV